MIKNDIQVFGLPRSGTNFVEWTLMNNFEEIQYSNIYAICNVYGIEMYRTAVKHNLPCFKYSDKIIVIYKDYDKWIDSFRRDNRKFIRKADPKQIWKKYYDHALALPEEKTIIVNHTWAVKNYNEFLELIKKKFKFKLIENPVQPEIRTDGGGAGCQLSGEKFKLI